MRAARRTSGMPTSSERFVRIAQRVERAVSAGELTFAQLGVLIGLALRANRQNYRAAEAEFTLAGLADALAWPSSVETLRRCVWSLHLGGWITVVEKGRAPRGVWRVRLGLVSPLPLEAIERLQEQVRSRRLAGRPKPPQDGEPASAQTEGGGDRGGSGHGNGEDIAGGREEMNRPSRPGGQADSGLPGAAQRGDAQDERRRTGFGGVDTDEDVSTNTARERARGDTRRWSSTPMHGEAGVLSDAQDLVDRGEARWVE